MSIIPTDLVNIRVLVFFSLYPILANFTSDFTSARLFEGVLAFYVEWCIIDIADDHQMLNYRERALPQRMMKVELLYTQNSV